MRGSTCQYFAPDTSAASSKRTSSTRKVGPSIR